MADQIATVSKLRMIKKSGKLTSSELNDVVKAIKIQLGIL